MLVPRPTCVVRVTVAREPGFKLPRGQVTTPSAYEQAPCEVVAETKVARLERTLLKTTALAMDGPRLVTLTVTTALAPAFTRVAALVWATARSAAGEMDTT